MAITWDSVNDAKLITAFQQTSQVDYDAIARFMGSGCTVSAVKHRLARIREKAGIPGGRAGRSGAAGSSASAAATGDSATPATPKTPKKPRTTGRSAASTAAGPSSKRGRKNPNTPTQPKRVGSTGPIHAKRGIATKKTELKTVDGYPDLDYDDDAEEAKMDHSSDEEAFAK